MSNANKTKGKQYILAIHKDDAYYPDRKILVGREVVNWKKEVVRRRIGRAVFYCGDCSLAKPYQQDDGHSITGLFFYAVRIGAKRAKRNTKG
jgi:hypothetical protein